MNRLKRTQQLGNVLVILLFAGLLASASAQSEETESVIGAKGHGVITSADEKAEITKALVVLRKNGNAKVIVISDLQLQLQGSWKANTDSAEKILLTITGRAVDGDLDGSGTLLLTNDRKSLKELAIKAKSADGREITVSFIADDSEPK